MKSKILFLLVFSLISINIVGCTNNSVSKIESEDALNVEINNKEAKLSDYKTYEKYMTDKGYKFSAIDDDKEYARYKSVLYSELDAIDIYVSENKNGIDNIKIKIFNNMREEGFEDKFKDAIKDTLSCYFDENALKDIETNMKKSIDLKNKENQNITIKFNDNLSMSFTQLDNNLFFDLYTTVEETKETEEVKK